MFSRFVPRATFRCGGDKELAIKNYEKSLELNPQNSNGAAMLKKLRGQ